MSMHEYVPGAPHHGSAENHKQIQAEKASVEMEKLLGAALQSAQDGDRGKAKMWHMLAFTAFEEHQKKGELTEEQEKAYSEKLHKIFSMVEREEAA